MMRVKKEPILSKNGQSKPTVSFIKENVKEYRVLESVSHLAIKLMNLLAEMERFLRNLRIRISRDQVLELYFYKRVLNIHDILDENYVIYSEYQQDGRFGKSFVQIRQ